MASKLVQPTIVVVSILLALGGRAGAATLITVGPDGDWPTIQQAIDAVSTPPGEVIRIQAGSVFQENLTIDLAGSGGTLEISGGWDASFTTMTADPTLTVIDGNGMRAVDVVVPTGTNFFFSNITVQGGGGATQGGGMRLQATSSGIIGISGVVFRNNAAVSTPGDPHPSGGGLYLDLASSAAETNGNQFLDNAVAVQEPQTYSHNAAGGGLYATLSGSSSLELADNLFQGSTCSAETNLTHEAKGCALYLASQDSSTFVMQRNTIIDSSSTGFQAINSDAGYILCFGTSGDLERNRWQGASSVLTPDESRRMVVVSVFNSCVLKQRSSLIAGSDDDGLVVVGNDTALWYGVNLTVAGNQGIGIGIVDNGTALHYLSNSISYANGDNLELFNGATIMEHNNLIDSDPGFAYPAGGVYMLREGSPALDSGTATAPGGLSVLDLAGRSRVQGATVDIGAYEGIGLVFEDGFESGNTSAWSSTTG